MKLNRHIMREHGISEKDIAKILNKVLRIKTIKSIETMSTINGKITFIKSFDTEEFAVGMREFIKTLRFDAVSKNERLLRIVESIKWNILWHVEI